MKLTQTFAAAALAVTAAAGTAKADGNDEKTVPLKYIECTGEQWVDIDFTPTATTIVEMDVDFTDDTGAWHNTLFCSRASDASHPFSLYALGGNLGWRFDYGVAGANLGLRYPAATPLHIKASASGFYANEVLLLSAPSSESFVPEGKMMLFASYSGGFGAGVSNCAKLRCWAVVLRDSADATFVRVLLPYSVNGRACLRDMKTGTPYYSGSGKDLVPGDDDCQLLRVTGAPFEIGQPTPAYGLTLVEGTVVTCKAERVVHYYWGKTSCTLVGWRQYCMTGAGWTRNRTGSGSECCVVTTNGLCWVDWRYRVRSRMSKLPGEYEELAYVQSDGRQYFDTRYAPKAETRVVARYRLTRSGEWPHYIFGCQDGTCRFKFSHSNADGKGVIFGYDESVSTDVNPKIRDDAMDHVVDVSNGVFRVDGETAWTAGAPWSTSGNSSSIYLFASHEVVVGGTVGYYSSTAIGGFTIYEDNAVVHDFVPCRRKSDGAVGFYDRKATQDPFRTGVGAPLGAGPVLTKSNTGLCIMVF